MIKTAMIYLIADFCLDKIDETIRFNMLQPEIRNKLRGLRGRRNLIIEKWAPVLDQLDMYESGYDRDRFVMEAMGKLLDNQIKLNNGMKL